MFRRRIISFIMALCLLATVLPAGQVYAATGCDAPSVSAAYNTSQYPGKPRLSWSAVKGAEKYRVYRSVDGGATYTPYFTTELCVFNNASAESGETYYYKVAAVAANGTEYPSRAVHITAACQAPVIHGGRNTRSYPGKPQLTWDAVKGAVTYEIYRANNKNSAYSLFYTTTLCNYTNTTAKNGYAYYYKVAAVTAEGARTYSQALAVTAACSAPDVSITRHDTACPGKPHLSWSAVNGAETYEIYRATARNGSFSRYFTTEYCYFNNASATADKTYYYQVAAVTSDGIRTYSPVVSLTAGCSAPQCSDTLSDGTLNGKSFTQRPKISWPAVEGAAYYRIYRAVGDGQYSLYDTTEKTNYTNASASKGRVYHYKVAAVTSGGLETVSKAVRVVMKCATPELTIRRVNGLYSTDRPYVGKPDLSWLVVEGAKSYEIYRASSKNGSYTLYTTTGNPYFTNTAASSNTTYYYKVKAIATDSAANSNYSSVKSLTTSAATPSYLVPAKTYTIKVNIKTNTVNVYTYDKNGKYTVPVKVMVCSDGYSTEELLGESYSLAYTGQWRWLKMHEVYAQYVTQISGNYLFHSVPYTDQKHNALEYWEFDKLGSVASAGCIRMQVKDAMWIYQHKNDIKSVSFYSSSDPGPLGKPIAPKVSGNGACRGWDPSDPSENNPWRNAKITVANYLGKTELDAVKAASERGFTVARVRYQHSDASKGTVIAQSRKAGSNAPMNATLTLTVSAG